VQRLGKGSFGVVLQALDMMNSMKPVAIKIAKGNSSFDRENTR
jgi:serine/threonine protein kinase